MIGPLPRPAGWAHAVGVVAAAAWCVYSFFATGLFMRLTGAGLALYLVGLPVCYALGRYGAEGIGWVVATMWRSGER